MLIWICTDMEGLSGVNEWDQFSHPDDNSPKYLDGIRHLHGDLNAAVAGCFDAGATEVRVLDGHGRNRNKGLRAELLDPRAKKMWVASRDPLRWEGLDESVTAVAMIGQHAMAGTVNGYTDHTQSTKTICALRINGEEHGEMSQFACYAGGCGIPLMYVSGRPSFPPRGLNTHETRHGLGDLRPLPRRGSQSQHPPRHRRLAQADRSRQGVEDAHAHRRRVRVRLVRTGGSLRPSAGRPPPPRPPRRLDHQ